MDKIVILSPIATPAGSSGITHFANQGAGGLHAVETLEALNAISANKLVTDMFAFVGDQTRLYRYDGTEWVLYRAEVGSYLDILETLPDLTEENYFMNIGGRMTVHAEADIATISPEFVRPGVEVFVVETSKSYIRVGDEWKEKGFALAASVTTLTNNLAAANVTIGTLTTDLGTANTTIGTLTADLAAANVTIGTLTTDLAALVARVEALETPAP